MISPLRMVLRGVRHYWRIHAAVAAAAAVGVAVLAGALIVGDSVRHSLRTLALDRLGRIDRAVVARGFVRESLAQAFDEAVPAIVMPGAAERADGAARSGDVALIGVDAAFWRLGGAVDESLWQSLDAFSCMVNRALADELHLEPGDDVMLRLESPHEAARESWLGRRNDTVAGLRLTVRRILDQRDLARFAMRPTQDRVRNVFVPLAVLQDHLERPGRINAIVAPARADLSTRSLRRAASLADYPLRLRATGADGWSFESDRVFLSGAEEDAACLAAERTGADARTGFAYMANWIEATGSRGRRIPYSMLAGLGTGGPKPGEAIANDWTARQMDAAPGDPVTLTYFVDDGRGGLTETSTTLRLAEVRDIDDPIFSSDWVPAFPGIAEAERIAGWQAPFPLDMDRVLPADEEYWDQYRTRPKVVLSLQDARALWATRYGAATSVRLQGASEEVLRRALRENLSPAEQGVAIVDLRTSALEASRGTSDFGQLFLGFSLFLIASAAMLIQILFRLSIETRARSLGLLGAVGWTRERIAALALAEGGLVAGAGALVGVALGAAYGLGLIHGLNTWWVGAIGRGFLAPFIRPASLAIALAAGWLVAAASMALAVRRITAMAPRVLLTGRTEETERRADGSQERQSPRDARRSRSRGWALAALCLCDAAAVVWAFADPPNLEGGLFYLMGGLLLATGLVGFSWAMSGERASGSPRLGFWRLGASGARRRPSRSLLVGGLMATASFLVVAVGANRHAPELTGRLDSGTGGLTVLAESAMPVYEPPRGVDIAASARLWPMRLRPGDNASCTNLYRTSEPRVLGAPHDFIQRGGFLFANSLAGDAPTRRNPWLLLERHQESHAIPAIGDYTTVRWLLHLGLGQELTVGGARLRIVALLRNSVFQSGLIVSQDAFEAAWPREAGWRFFAVESPPERSDEIVEELENRYGEFGMDAMRADNHLADLKRVENTYLSTFQALGGLGLLLGTLGLALAMARNLIERRRELALLRALGFGLGRVWTLAVLENAFLLIAGLGWGTICALVAVGPALAARSVRPPWASLSGLVAGVLAFGLASAGLCAWLVLRHTDTDSLKKED